MALDGFIDLEEMGVEADRIENGAEVIALFASGGHIRNPLTGEE